MPNDGTLSKKLFVTAEEEMGPHVKDPESGVSVPARISRDQDLTKEYVRRTLASEPIPEVEEKA